MRTMDEQVIKWCKATGKEIPKKQRKNKGSRKRKNTEKLSQSDLNELMDVNKRTYKRHRGAFRQK